MTKKTIIALLLAFLCITAAKAQTEQNNEYHKYAVATNPFWSNWYIQAGLDMTLQNPYGTSFSHTFPRGKTFGIHTAAGKWFTPAIGVRVKAMWDNGIIENKHLQWVAPFGRNGENFDDGGIAGLYGEVHLSLTNAILGYDEARKWDLSVYPRGGLAFNFSIGSTSPLIGVGLINTYKLNQKLSLYLDLAYNMTTTEYTDGATWSGGGKNGNANGYLDICVGVQFNLGKSTFRRLSE